MTKPAVIPAGMYWNPVSQSLQNNAVQPPVNPGLSNLLYLQSGNYNYSSPQAVLGPNNKLLANGTVIYTPPAASSSQAMTGGISMQSDTTGIPTISGSISDPNPMLSSSAVPLVQQTSTPSNYSMFLIVGAVIVVFLLFKG